MRNRLNLQDMVSMPRRVFAVAALAALSLAACNEAGTATMDVDMSKPRAAAGSDFSNGYEKTDLGWAVGAKDAPVKLVEYGSFTCGGCAGFHAQVYPKLREEFVDPGYVRFEFRSFLRNEPDILATMVAQCVGEDNFKGIKNLYFSSIQKWLGSANPNDYVAVMARRAGVNSAAFRQCVSQDDLRNQLVEQTRAAQKAWADDDGYFRTPTVIVNETKLSSGFAWEEVSQAIERALRS